MLCTDEYLFSCSFHPAPSVTLSVSQLVSCSPRTGTSRTNASHPVCGELMNVFDDGSVVPYLALPGQIVFLSSALVERDEEMCAAVTVWQRNLLGHHLLSCGRCSSLSQYTLMRGDVSLVRTGGGPVKADGRLDCLGDGHDCDGESSSDSGRIDMFRMQLLAASFSASQ